LRYWLRILHDFGHINPKEFVSSFYLSYHGFHVDAKKAILAATLNATSRSFSGFVLVLYLASLGYTLRDIGLITSIGLMCGAASLLPSGRLADYLGRARAMVCSVFLSIFGTVIYIFSNSFFTFVLASSTMGIADSMYGPAYSALLSNKVSDKRRNYLFGAERFSTMVGSTSAIFFAGLVPDILEKSGYTLGLGFRIVLLISIFVLICEIPFLYNIADRDNADELENLDGGSYTQPSLEKVKDYKTESKEDYIVENIIDDKRIDKKEKGKERFWILDKESTSYIAKYTFANSLIAFGAGFVIPFMQLYFTIHYKAPMAIVASVFSITSLLMAISYLLVPKLAERIGSIRTIVFTQGVSIIMLIAIPLSYPYFTLAAIFYLVRTVLMNAASPIGTSYILGCVKKNERAFAASIITLLYNVSNSLSPPISGWIMANYNMDIPFFICALFYMVACGAYYFFFENKDRK